MRIVTSLESGPHAGLEDLAKRLGHALSAMVASPTVSESDTHGASPLALALARLQANCRAIGRCPPCPGDQHQLILVTDCFFGDALFVDNVADAEILRQMHALYGRRLGIDAHVPLVLQLPVEEMYVHSISACSWPKCSIKDLTDLPSRLASAATRFALAHTLPQFVACPASFDNCDVELDGLVAVAAKAVLAQLRRMGWDRRAVAVSATPPLMLSGYVDVFASSKTAEF